MTTKQNRTPWIIVGALGCLASCLLVALGGGGVYLLLRSARATPVVESRQTASPMPLVTTSVRATPAIESRQTASPVPLVTPPSQPVSVISLQNIGDVVELKRLSDGGGPFAWSPDDHMLATGREKTITLWEMPSGRNLRTFAAAYFRVYSAAFSPDGKLLATAEGFSITLWETATGRKERTLGEEIFDVAFSPDGKMVAGAKKGPTAVLWDLASGKELYTLSDPSKSPDGNPIVTFSPNGEMLALGSSTLTLWNVKTGKLITSLPARAQGGVVFLQNGTTIATQDGIWDIKTGQVLQRINFNRSIACMTFSPDGSIMAFEEMPLPDFGPPEIVKLWNATTMTELRTLGPNVSCPLAFSPDGQLLATRDAFFSTKLWGVPR